MPRKSSWASGQMFDHRKLQKWLAAYRKHNNLTLREVAAQTGISISRLSDLQHGKIKHISSHYLTAFACALGYDYLADFVAEVELSLRKRRRLYLS